MTSGQGERTSRLNGASYSIVVQVTVPVGVVGRSGRLTVPTNVVGRSGRLAVPANVVGRSGRLAVPANVVDAVADSRCP